jgi:hypothetical protein
MCNLSADRGKKADNSTIFNRFPAAMYFIANARLKPHNLFNGKGR